MFNDYGFVSFVGLSSQIYINCLFLDGISCVKNVQQPEVSDVISSTNFLNLVC